MKRILYSVVAITAIITACSEQYAESYTIQGATSVASLDQQKLYLKEHHSDDTAAAVLDSCEVIHGEFAFSGKFDTIRMAEMAIVDGNLPIVIEKGDINVSIERTGQKVSGSPHNDKLYDFREKHIQLENLMYELGHKETQMILEGIDEYTIAQRLTAESSMLMARIDSLETRFIIDNADNVLGPYAFYELTRQYRYPVMTPQIEEILVKVSDKFKNDPYVSSYCKSAQDILARMRGETDDEAAPADNNGQQQ